MSIVEILKRYLMIFTRSVRLSEIPLVILTTCVFDPGILKVNTVTLNVFGIVVDMSAVGMELEYSSVGGRRSYLLFPTCPESEIACGNSTVLGILCTALLTIKPTLEGISVTGRRRKCSEL